MGSVRRPTRLCLVRIRRRQRKFLQLSLDQVFGVLCISPGESSQNDGSTALWGRSRGRTTPSGSASPRCSRCQQVGCLSYGPHSVILGRTSLATVPEDPQTLIA